MFAFSLFANVLNRRTSSENYPAMLRKAAVGAFAVSSAIQYAGEKYLDVAGFNHGDMTDAAYGIAFSAVAAALCMAGYQRAHNADQRVLDHYYPQKADSPAEAPRGVNASNKTTIKRVNPQQRKNARKQQKASRRKNR